MLIWVDHQFVASQLDDLIVGLLVLSLVFVRWVVLISGSLLRALFLSDTNWSFYKI